MVKLSAELLRRSIPVAAHEVSVYDEAEEDLEALGSSTESDDVNVFDLMLHWGGVEHAFLG